MLERILPNHLPSQIGYYIWKSKITQVNMEYLKKTFYVDDDFFIKIYLKKKNYDLYHIKRKAYNYRDLNHPNMYSRLIKGHEHRYLPFRYYYSNGTFAKDYGGFSQNN
jgi:hypothetical protein